MTTTGADPLFVDTNILIYSTDSSSPWHGPAVRALQDTFRGSDKPIVSPQILREFLAASTRAAVMAGNVSLSRIFNDLAAIRATFTVLEESDAVIGRLIELVQEVAVAGKQIHDANIVATMQVHGIRRLLTNNESHFARFSHLITIVPLRSFL